MPPRSINTTTHSTRSRSPTPNKPEEDPFRRAPSMSPETAAAKKRLKNYTNKTNRNINYAKKFKKFLASVKNENIEHLQTNASNFNNKLKNVNNPTYLLSDVLNSPNGRVRHVYSRDYLNKVFKNKTIHRGPHTGIPTGPTLMRRYFKNITYNNRVFQNQKRLFIAVFGKTGYYDTPLQTKHILGQIQQHHLKFTLFIRTRFRTFERFCTKFLMTPENVYGRLRTYAWYDVTPEGVNKIIDIVKVVTDTHRKEIQQIRLGWVVFIHKIIQIMYDIESNPQVKKLLNNHREFYNQFKNLLNL